jgi:MoaA/NifB/PqqE/SkfB family radical SAM enzyme
MDIYKLLKINKLIKNHRIKFLGLYLLHFFNKRYLAINLDPIMACNLRCKMCYFTDKEYLKTLKGNLKEEDLNCISNAVFKRALKLQIGCGTEPTLYRNLSKIVELGKKHKVPYISLTTNANLLSRSKIEELLKAGLNEFTISMHGVRKDTYEDFMQKGDYHKFRENFNFFEKFKKTYKFKVRLNYTFNKDNFNELKDLFNYYNGNIIDVLQIRPIQKLGNTQYNNFDLTSIKNEYNSVLEILKNQCKNHNIILLAPQDLLQEEITNVSSVLFNYTFFYISPNSFERSDFNWKKESFEEFSKRTKWGNKILKNVLKSKRELISSSKHLNYDISI